jgi:hypothetical protein
MAHREHKTFIIQAQHTPVNAFFNNLKLVATLGAHINEIIRR